MLLTGHFCSRRTKYDSVDKVVCLLSLHFHTWHRHILAINYSHLLTECYVCTCETLANGELSANGSTLHCCRIAQSTTTTCLPSFVPSLVNCNDIIYWYQWWAVLRVCLPICKKKPCARRNNSNSAIFYRVQCIIILSPFLWFIPPTVRCLQINL